MANEVKIVVTAQDKTKGTFKNVRAGMGAIVKGAAVLGAGLAVAMFKASGAARESAKITKQTGAVIKSTGGVANISARQVDALANALSKKTGVDDEVIKSGENLLLTFTNVRNEAGKGNDIFNQAIPILNDMSVALGQDMKSSAIQVGKALNDPIKGITALKRVGVTFNDEQVKTIKHLVNTGKTAEAQKVILAELRKEFGGSAEAQATWADKAKVAAGNVQEAFGELVNKTFAPIGKWFAEVGGPAIEDFFKKVGKNKEFNESLKRLGQAIGDITDKDFAGTLNAVAKALPGIVDGMTDAAHAVGEFYDAIVAVNKIIGKEARGGMFDGKGPLGSITRWFKKSWHDMTTSFLRDNGQIVTGIKQMAGRVIDWLRRLPGRAATAISSLSNKIDREITDARDLAVRRAREMLNRFVDRMQELVRRARSEAGKVKGAITSKFSGAANWLYSAGRNVINGLGNGLKTAFDRVKRWVSGIAKWIKDHKGPVSLDRQLLVPAGKALMGGLLEGLKFGFGGVGDFVYGAGSKVSDIIKKIKDTMFLGDWTGKIGSLKGGGNKLLNAIRNTFGIGGGTYPGHGERGASKAWDFMATGAKGNAIASFVKTFARALNVLYIIWNKRIWSVQRASEGWRPYTRYGSSGSPSQMHTNHVHVSLRDRGGMLWPGQIGGNLSGLPERVLSPRQTRSFDQLVKVISGNRGTAGGGSTYIINAPNYVGDKKDLVKALTDLDRQGRLAVVKR